MGAPFSPTPWKWAPEQAAKARTIRDAGRQAFDGDDEDFKTLSDAVDWYDEHQSDDGGAPAPDTQPSAPTPAPTPAPAPAPAQAPQTEMPWYEVLTRGARDTAGMGFADEAGGQGARLYDAFHGFDETDTPRAASPDVSAPVDPSKTSYTAERDAQRVEDARALAESPKLYRTGEAIGIAGTAAAPVSKLGKFAPAVLGATNAVGASENEGGDLVADAAKGAVVGQALGTVGGKVAEKIAQTPLARRIAARVAERSEAKAARAADLSNRNYLRASGVRKGPLDVLDREPGAVARYAEGGRRLGIGKGFLPQKTEAFGDDAARVVKESDAQRKALEAVLKEKGATVDPGALSDKILQLREGYAPGGDASQPLINTIEKVARNQQRMAPTNTIETEMGPVEVRQPIPWQRVNTERQKYGNATTFRSTNPRQAIRSEVYGALNEALADAADESIPGAGAKWRQAGEDEHIGLTLGKYARDRENAEITNQVIKPSTYAVGGITHLAGGTPLEVAAATGGKEFIRGRGHALLDRLHGRTARAYNAQAGALRNFAPNVSAAGTRVAARPLGAATAGTAPAMARADGRQGADDPLADFANSSPQARAGAARGQMVPDAAMQLLQSQPDALGKWAPELLKARQQGEGQFAAAITRLSSDPEFARDVLPRLQAMTAAPSSAAAR